MGPLQDVQGRNISTGSQGNICWSDGLNRQCSFWSGTCACSLVPASDKLPFCNEERICTHDSPPSPSSLCPPQIPRHVAADWALYLARCPSPHLDLTLSLFSLESSPIFWLLSPREFRFFHVSYSRFSSQQTQSTRASDFPLGSWRMGALLYHHYEYKALGLAHHRCS